MAGDKGPYEEVASLIKSPKSWLFISLFVYIFCLPFTAFHIGGDHIGGYGDYSGYKALIGGWPGLFVGVPADRVWLANPLLFASWVFILLKKKRVTAFLSVAAFLTGASFSLFKTVAVVPMVFNSPITGYDTGYWLWLASMACAVVGAIFMESEKSTSSTPLPSPFPPSR
jgi:hypothetical protein